MGVIFHKKATTDTKQFEFFTKSNLMKKQRKMLIKEIETLPTLISKIDKIQKEN